MCVIKYRCKNKIEDDFYLGNSDKIMFLMSEFKAHLHPDNIYNKASPLLVAKLDIEVIINI